MLRTISLIAKLNPEQTKKLLEVLNHPGDVREICEDLSLETLAAFQKIIETALEGKRSA